MEANLSFEKKSSRVPLTEACCRLAFPCVRPCAGTAPFCCSSRQTWISARPLYSVVQLLICSRPFQSKNSSVREGGWEGGAGRGNAKRGRKKNWGTERKCRRDKHASSLRSKEVVSSKQAMSALWLSLKGGWPMWMCCFSCVLVWRNIKNVLQDFNVLLLSVERKQSKKLKYLFGKENACILVC